eukprot:12026084-Alexandrium_andersonii.AAC.1
MPQASTRSIASFQCRRTASAFSPPKSHSSSGRETTTQASAQVGRGRGHSSGTSMARRPATSPVK